MGDTRIQRIEGAIASARRMAASLLPFVVWCIVTVIGRETLPESGWSWQAVVAGGIAYGALTLGAMLSLVSGATRAAADRRVRRALARHLMPFWLLFGVAAAGGASIASYAFADRWIAVWVGCGVALSTLIAAALAARLLEIRAIRAGDVGAITIEMPTQTR